MQYHARFRSTLTALSLLATVTLAQTDRLDSGSWEFKPYHGNRDQFTLDIPGTWTPFDQNPRASEGVIAFYSQSPIQPVAKDADPEEQAAKFRKLAEGLVSGAVPSFWAERSKAGKGMSCTGFSEQAQAKKVKYFAKGTARGQRAKITGQPDVSKIEFAGCQGLRVLMHADIPGSPGLTMLAYSATADNVNYDFILLNEPSYLEQNRLWFERIMTTVKLTGAR